MEGTHDAQTWIQGRESFNQRPPASLRTAQKVVRKGGWRMGQRMAEESRSIDTVFHAGTGHIEEPEQRGTVGNEPIKALRGLAVFSIGSAQGNDLGVAKLDG
jgi:hypothetical protein